MQTTKITLTKNLGRTPIGFTATLPLNYIVYYCISRGDVMSRPFWQAPIQALGDLDPNRRAISEAEIKHTRLRQASQSVTGRCDR